MEGFTGSQVIMQPEADSIVKGLQPFMITEVGSKTWQAQRSNVERLNCQAHHNTATQTSDYVTELILSHDKVSVIIHELLVIEQWRKRVYPSIRDDVSAKNPAAMYSLLYYEGILVNLLELLFWTEEGVSRADEDILEVLDYLWRNIVTLNTHAEDDYWPLPPEDVEQANAQDHRLQSERRQEFTICMTSISVLWYIIDKAKILPMAALNNILKKNDMPVGLACLLDNRVWLRRDSSGMSKFKTKEWKRVEKTDIYVVCEYEAHAWFIMHMLLTAPDCREKYNYNIWRKEQILKIRKFLNEILLDQIPPLAEVQRALDELSFLEPPHSTEEKFRSSLVIEPVPRIMNSIRQGTNWESLINDHRAMLTDPRRIAESSKEMSAMLDQIIGTLEGDTPDTADITKLLKDSGLH
eukprot:TRINITY_DN7018_c4_g1_i1.p1 TRINITY_DN7018_c4_g1~~TRINITY_DN7018_c4_g1_i1.p1  ORF type:complete len:410 (+),score=64.02 TRINITY_DN7018_c4_g1_i1:103-1332(+)